MKCRVPRLKSCCCCVNLRAGCFFLALFEICASILGFCAGEGKQRWSPAAHWPFCLFAALYWLNTSHDKQYCDRSAGPHLSGDQPTPSDLLHCLCHRLRRELRLLHPGNHSRIRNTDFQRVLLDGGILLLATPSMGEQSRKRRLMMRP